MLLRSRKIPGPRSFGGQHFARLILSGPTLFSCPPIHSPVPRILGSHIVSPATFTFLLSYSLSLQHNHLHVSARFTASVEKSMFRYALRRGLTQRWRDVRRAPLAFQWLPGPRRSSSPQPWRIQAHTRSAHADARCLSAVSHRNLGDDTIYALSSGAGRAGIAVIRISGPGCLDVCNCPLKSGSLG